MQVFFQKKGGNTTKNSSDPNENHTIRLSLSENPTL